MLKPKTLVAFAFLAVAAVGAYLTVHHEDPHVRRPGELVRPLPALIPAQIDRLTITDAKGKDPKQTIVLVRAGTEWKMEKPVADRADGKGIERTLDALAKMTLSDQPIAHSRTSWEKLQVRDEDLVTVVIRQGGAEHTLELGGGKYARIGSSDDVWEVSGLSRYVVAKEARLWRDREVMRFDADKVASVSVRAADGGVVAAQRTPAPEPKATDAGPPPPREHDKWTLTAGADRVGKLDEAVPAAIVQALAHFDAYDFGDGVTREAAGLGAPRLTVEVKTDDGQAHVLLVGGDAGDSVYVGVPEGDRVWKAQKAQIEAVTREPLQWRDKSIADVLPADVARIEITHDGKRLVLEAAGDDWKPIEPPDLKLSQAKAKGLAGAMRNLRGAAIVYGAAPADAQLGKPSAHALFKLKDGKTIGLTIGAKKDAQWYAQATTRPELFLMNDYLARRFLKAPSDLEGGSDEGGGPGGMLGGPGGPHGALPPGVRLGGAGRPHGN